MTVQLALWDASKQIPAKAQVELVRCDDKGYDVRHILSGLIVCRFQPTFVTKADAQLYCDMLSEVDLDAWWLAGRPNDGTPRRAHLVMCKWRETAFPGVWNKSLIGRP